MRHPDNRRTATKNVNVWPMMEVTFKVLKEHDQDIMKVLDLKRMKSSFEFMVWTEGY
jgi:hypothetical protein